MGSYKQRRKNRHKNQLKRILSLVRLKQNQLTSPEVTRIEHNQCSIGCFQWCSLKLLSDYSDFIRDIDRSIDLKWY